MTRKLRSNFERGTSRWAVRRAQWRALGLTDEDMEKPKIAVVNSSSELAICFSHLDGVAAEVKDAIRAAGGVPFEVRTAAPSDFITSAGARGGYILSARDLIANDIEVAVEGAQLDGMICLASCDKTTPGQIMAAGRLNIPTIVAICGYQPSGEYKGKHVDIEDVFLTAGHTLMGKVSVEDLEGMSDNAIRGPGVCSGMGTANSMHIVSEALGMSLPGHAPVRANSAEMFEFVRQAGTRIVEMVWEDLKPRQILTAGAFGNAVMAVLAVSGSINAIKHLQAMAIEAGCDVDVYKLFEDNASRIPVLSAVRPIGDYSIEDFEEAGGARALMKQLEGFVNQEAMTVSGRTAGENIRDAVVENDDAIRPVTNPFSTKPAIAIVRGSLAPEGAVVKLGLVEDRAMTFNGPAIIFDSADEAMEAVRNGQVISGQVVILRGLGVKGGPGMATASRVVFAIDGAGLETDVALVTDGQMSGLVNKGMVICEVSPEAAGGGPLMLVEDGDPIAIDLERRTVDLAIPDQEMAARLERLGHPALPASSGWLSIYQRTVQPLNKGAVISKVD